MTLNEFRELTKDLSGDHELMANSEEFESDYRVTKVNVFKANELIYDFPTISLDIEKLG